MPKRVLGKCPVCREELAITCLRCPACSTEISGIFSPCPYCRLDPDQEQLVSVFLKSRGNIREVERELGISYPTVRSRLDEVLKALGITPKERGRGGRPTGPVGTSPVEGGPLGETGVPPRGS
ncbi:MAG: DUF2089 family protein [Planctomycetota bacterium]|jgi:hypothetical protein